MDKAYNSSSEAQIYNLWLSSGAFTPKIDKNKKPFSIILPLPNANNPMHMGHAVFTVQDIMVRFHRMLGKPTLWLPGADHAGIETQFVYEKKIAKKGKSRFDFDRQTLYQLIWDFVEENKKLNQFQMKRLGFSLDWTRYHYSLEPRIIENVLNTFLKLYQDNLIYRDEKIVNYCTYCGTAFSNLEVEYKTVASHLWYIKYGPLTIATTRPETMLGDTAIAVNPKDKRYKNLIGKTVFLPLVNKKIPVIMDNSIDMKFGTGAVKITPSHSLEDYDMAKRHNLKFIRIFDYDGKSNQNVPQKYQGFYPSQVRQMILTDLQSQGLLVKTEDYSHQVGHCYRCGRLIEPITAPQWYLKTDKLAAPAIKVAKTAKIKFFPPRFKKTYLDWMENIRDWNISRQIVWGPRIPAWYCLDCNPNIKLNFLDKNKNIVSNFYKDIKNKYSFEEINSGLQSLIAPVDATFVVNKSDYCLKCKSTNLIQETDTFDTWFLSGQWPLNALGFNPIDPKKSSPDFNYFYPTTIMDTMWDILFFWVARMIMFGLYLTDKVPFKTVHLHARCVDAKGQKMSKSKGNAINPLDMTQKYGTDALRMALVYGIAPASDFVISEDKIRSQRNFVNKIWNASRFIEMHIDRLNPQKISSKVNKSSLIDDDKKILKNLDKIIASTTRNLKNYRFGQASEDLYQFFWHEFCDVYIESVKSRGEETISVLLTVLINSLKLLHPFIPFITETIYQDLISKYDLPKELLISSSWPTSEKI